MSDTKFLKCTCAQCGGHIEFPAEGIGMKIPCPHCGWETELTLGAPEASSSGSSRSLKWFIAGVVILVVGVVGVLGAFVMAKRLLHKPRAQAVARTPRPPKTTNAAPVVSPVVPA